MGIARYKGPPLTLEDMDRAVDEAVLERWERFERQQRK